MIKAILSSTVLTVDGLCKVETVDGLAAYVRLIPRDCDDARILFEMLGMSCDYDNDGQLVVYTGFHKK